MVDLHSFEPLIGKRFGSPEFEAAIKQLGRGMDTTLSCELIEATTPQNCEPNSPLKALYKKEQLLVISSDEKLLATYRAYAPYDDQTDKYPQGDAHYIMPRYKLTHDFDKSLSAYLIYYLSITAHRYLEVIKSFYATPEGEELDYNKDKAVDETKSKLKELLKLKDAFGKKGEPETDLRKQKRACKKHYKSLLSNLANIIIRRAEPFTTTSIDEVITKAFMRSTADVTSRMKPEPPNDPIKGPNDEMELMIRYNILGLKLIVHDFNLLNSKFVDPTEHSADRKEFESINLYLMMKPEFEPKKSDGKVTEPIGFQLKEFWNVMNEIHGEVGKVGAVLAWVEKIPLVEKDPERTLEQAFARRETLGYAMLENRIHKISRCAYYIDSAQAAINTTIRGRDEIKAAVQEFVDAAKLKVFTSSGSQKFSDVCEVFSKKSNALAQLADSPEAHLKPEQKSALAEFISVTNSMTETKRRQEDAIGKIRNAGTVNQR